MSLSISFNNNKFNINKLELPSRYYYFNDDENYIKLLSIGEGIFPKDKIKTKLFLENSSAIFTTESATKVYPSKKEFGINKIDITLKNSNCEFINDELILFKNAKLLQFIKIKLDNKSTLFFADILSHGREYENYSFDSFFAKNSFYINEKIEYLERYKLSGTYIKDYINEHNSQNNLFAKIYLRCDFQKLEMIFKQNNIKAYSYTKTKGLVILALSEESMHKLKDSVKKIWVLYRKVLEKQEFELGKF